LRTGFEEYQVIRAKELAIITKLKHADLSGLKSKNEATPIATWYNEAEFNSLIKGSPVTKLIAHTFDMRSHLLLPVTISPGKICNFYFYSRRPDAYSADHPVTGQRFGQLLVNFINRMLSDPNNPLMGESDAPAGNNVHEFGHNFFDGIIGNSHLLLNVFDNVIQVAPADSSVLILGESGTGKEKIADRVHHLSPRKARPFIKISCASLPATLIDSELFGHEKGAFTGAIEKKIGRFEQAHTGTIFLDEIGELPLELQVKLLRVLQEREIERIGGRVTIKTDVRVIAATNRNLEKEVAEGRFRLDLYYRLNVFPIVMPPLRDRKEDIPALANHFLNIYNRKTGKAIKGLTDKVLANLQNYNWPGNIRELENLVERNVLLAKGEWIEHIDLPSMHEQPASEAIVNINIKTMRESERAHILAALKKCNGKIWGEGGAADLLNLPPTTLNSKMKKLGIKKGFPGD
jgi:transcriptional regulator with GAF, ATPase, and Fis domain